MAELGRVLVLGAGGIGGGMGGLLARAGTAVELVARGAHLDALRTDGLRVGLPDERFSVRLPAHRRLADARPTPDDLVLLAVKCQHTAALLRELPPEVPVACAQNGMTNEPLVASRVRRVLGLMVYVPAVHLRPGHVQLHGHPGPGRIDVGDHPDGAGDLAGALAAALRSAGFDSDALPDIMAWKRAKHLTNLGGALQVLGELDMDRARALWEEGRAVFEAAGLPCRGVQELFDRVGPLELRPVAGIDRVGGSTLQDHLRGRPLESAWLNGHVSELGRRHGVPTPLNDAVLERLAAL